MCVDGELDGAVGVGRPGGRVLADRHRLGLAVGGRGRGEDDPPAVGGAHRLEQRERAADVGVPVVLGLLLGRADQALGREVQHRLGPDVGQHRRRSRAARPAASGRAGGDGVGVPGGEVVEHGDLVAVGQQGGRDYAADVAGSAGDEYAHGATLGGHGLPAEGPSAEEAAVVSSRAGGAGAAGLQARPQPRRPGPRDRRRPGGQAGQQRGRLPAAARRRPGAAPRPPARPTAIPTTAPSCSPRALAERYGVDPGAGGHRLRRGHALPAAGPGLQRPGHQHRLRLALLRDVPAARPGRRRPRRSRCRSCPAARAARRTPTTSTALAAAIDETHPPGLRLQPEQPHRDGGAPRGARAVPRRRAARAPSSSSTRPTASSSPIPTSPTAWS